MNACVVIMIIAVVLLLAVIFTPRTASQNAEGFVEYVVYGPPWWGGYHPRWYWRRRFAPAYYW